MKAQVPPTVNGLVTGLRRVACAFAVLAVAAASIPAQEPAAPRYITAAEAVAWEGLPFQALRAYGDAPQQYGEVRLPPGPGPFPVAVVVHGGCWLSIADNDYMDPVAQALTDAGWATWNVEFRTLDQPGGGWPGIFRDVSAAADHLRVLADSFPLDLDRVVTVGHSSGGHLALWLAARPRIPAEAELASPDPVRVRGVVSLAGIADLAHYHDMKVPACGDTPSRLLGGQDPTASQRTAEASPAALLPLGVPQLLITGEDDYAVPPAHGEHYAGVAASAGDDVEHHVIAGSSHFEIVAPWSGPWAEAWRRIVPFLERIRAG